MKEYNVYIYYSVDVQADNESDALDKALMNIPEAKSNYEITEITGDVE